MAKQQVSRKPLVLRENYVFIQQKKRYVSLYYTSYDYESSSAGVPKSTVPGPMQNEWVGKKKGQFPR